MTKDEFAASYELHKPVAEGAIRSYFARRRSSNAVVMVHFLDGGDTPANRDRLARLAALDPEQKRTVLETCEVDSTITVVTRFIWDFTTLDAWLALQSKTPAPRTPAAHSPPPRRRRTPDLSDALTEPLAPFVVTPPPPAGSGPPPGEFTKLFKPPVDPVGSGKGAPGEFTSLFQPPVTPSSAAPGSPPASAPPVPPGHAGSSKPGPGEFTRLFSGSPPAAPEAPSPKAPPAKKGAGDFTRLFGGPTPPHASELPPVPPIEPAAPPPAPPANLFSFQEPPAAPDDLSQRLARSAEPPMGPPGATRAMPASGRPPGEPAQPTQPGDFTRMFGAAAPPPETTGPRTSFGHPVPSSMPPNHPPAQARPSTDYLARLGANPAPPVTPPPVPPTPLGAAGGRVLSEFTRALRRISVSVTSPEAETPVGESPNKSRSALPLVLGILAVVVFVMLAVILYFVLTME